MLATLALSLAQTDTGGSAASNALGIIIGLVVLAGLVGLAIFLSRRSSRGGGVSGAPGRPAPVTTIQKLPPDQYGSLINAIGAMIASQGYTPFSHGPGMYVYQKQQQANWAVAILLMLLCFVPGLVYLVVGGSTKTVTITVNDMGDTYYFNITGPYNMQRYIWSFLSPYNAIPAQVPVQEGGPVS